MDGIRWGRHLRLLAHLSRWLTTQGLDVGDLTPTRVGQFLEARRAEGRTHALTLGSMVPLLNHLRGLGVLPGEEPIADSPIDALIERYRHYLSVERGLAPSSVRGYAETARAFLSHRCLTTGGSLALDTLTSQVVTEFVLGQAQRRSVSFVKRTVTRLRCLLRFFHVEGLTERALAPAVPRMAGWRLASLPKALDPSHVARILEGCDRQSVVGSRDFAIIVLLARLGLRAGEVAALALSDIDWRQGQLIIHGKANRRETLPLPVDVGEALAGWLERGRPKCASRSLITRVRAPYGGLSPSGVSVVVRHACRRVGLAPVGAHRLRHTAATRMLRAGGNLAEVGQVLRHQSIETTAIYAKVDRISLTALVRPWPGSAA